MQKKLDREHPIPVMDCLCGEKDTPLTSTGPFVKKGKPEIYIWSCPACGRVPLDDSDIKGYISIEELEARGWKKGK